MDGTPLSAVFTAQAAVSGEARIGDVLDRRYRIDALIGEGGMAQVYKVTHTMIGKALAAKIVRPELRDDMEVIRRFLREAQIVSSIKHPNVVDISDYGEMPEGGAYCVMELLRGRTLAEIIDDDGAFSPEEALGVALQLCQGLQHSHEAGVVHRDLKPQNIFICDPKGGRDPVVKLIDFGVARAGQRITVAGAVLGTPEYMSPEQVQGQDVDAGADLYALGVILFELLTAAVPFRSDDVAITMQSHVHATPPKMTVVDPQLEHLAHTQGLIERLMAKSRADRPSTAAETGVLLQQAMQADLGQEAAERVVRATVAIGSGGIVTTPVLPPIPAEPWGDRQMPWNPDAPEAGPPQAFEPANEDIDDTDDPVPTGPGRSLPMVVVATALLASVGTLGGYAALGGFDRGRPPAAAAAPTAEIVSAPVAEPAEPSDPLQAAPGGKPDPSEQTPGVSASVVPSQDRDASVKPPADDEDPAQPLADAERDPEEAVPAEAPTKRPPRRTPKRKSSEQKIPDATASTPSAPANSKPAAEPRKPAVPALDGDLRNPFG